MFKAYKEQLSDFVQDLINSYDPFLEQPEHLGDLSDLEHFLRARGFTVSQPLYPEDLERVRDLREKLRSIWSASSVEALRDELNALLSTGQLSLQLSKDMGWRFAPEPEMSLIQNI